ncbi:MAG: tetratricopeptide repeat protein [Candidatus Sericytochromatia bacterium]
MDFNSLSSVSAGLTQQRSQKGGEACEQAYGSLALAHLNRFQNKAQLEAAVQDFMAAIRLSRRDAGAYVGMGYVLMLLRDYPRAERYLLTALRLDRQHPDVQPLLAELAARRNRPPLRAQPVGLPAGHPVSAADWDHLHDAVVARIRQTVAAAVAEPLPPAGVNAELIAALTQSQSRLQIEYDELVRLVRTLEAEFEADDLCRGLRPLEQLLRRMQATVSLSRQFQNLQADICRIRQALQRDLLSLNRNGAQSLAPFEARLEEYYDDCDTFADQLDAWEASGHSIAGLLKEYKLLLEVTDNLHERLDELHQDASPAVRSAA